MNNSLADMMATDAEFILSEIGELVTYNKANGQMREILAFVRRNPLQSSDQPRGVKQPVKIWVLNSSVIGIASSEVATNETVTYAEHIGGDNVTKRIFRPAGESYGWTILELM